MGYIVVASKDLKDCYVEDWAEKTKARNDEFNWQETAAKKNLNSKSNLGEGSSGSFSFARNV